MAQLHSRCNLSAARFPLMSNLQGRTVILPQYDMNYQRQAQFAGADADRDVGVPQVFYLHNVMPTEQGYQSVGFSTVINPVTGATDFDQAITLQDPEGNKFLYVPAAGKNYIFDGPVLSWASLNSISGLDDNILVTTAFVQGEMYIFYEQVGCFKYNKTTKNFDSVTLIGLLPENIVGIVGSNGYLLCWDINGVLYWSSTINPLDFTPSLVTGASSGNITDLKGRIVVILATVNGFIVYGTGNAVGGSFTGNIRFPFTLKEIQGSGGVRSKEHISYESNVEKQYALTSAGLQTLTKTTSEVVLSETTDFITSRIFEDFDSATKTFIVTLLSSDLQIKLTVVAARYFVLSYGVAIGTYTHALIYDLAQKKWGKVKIEHTDCFPFSVPNLYGEITYAMLETLGTTYADLADTMYSDLSSSAPVADKPRRTIGFLQKDGTVQILNFDLDQLDHSAVFLLGKYQFTRGSDVKLVGFDVENIAQTSNFTAHVLPSFDGKNFQSAVDAYLKVDLGYLRQYQVLKTARNVSLLFLGSFNLLSIDIHYAKVGAVQV